MPWQPAAIGAVGFEPEPFVWTATAQSILGKVDRARQALIQVKSGNITPYIPREKDFHYLEESLEFPDPSKTVVTYKKETGDPHSKRLRVVCRS